MCYSRDSRDDGILTGLLLGPLIVTALLSYSIEQVLTNSPILPTNWLIEPPAFLRNSKALSSSHAALLSRYGLVNLSTFCATILLLHVCASWWVERRCSTEGNKVDGERASVPRSEGKRSSYYVLFALATSVVMVTAKIVMMVYDVKLWNCTWFLSHLHIVVILRSSLSVLKDLNVFEAVIASLFFQFTLYVALRLAHRGFTLGELGLTCFGATALCLEFLNLTIARVSSFFSSPKSRLY